MGGSMMPTSCMDALIRRYRWDERILLGRLLSGRILSNGKVTPFGLNAIGTFFDMGTPLYKTSLAKYCGSESRDSARSRLMKFSSVNNRFKAETTYNSWRWHSWACLTTARCRVVSSR